jgi:hypothetical protein
VPIIKFDNRDMFTTDVRIQIKSMTELVQINPVDLMRSMIQNLPSPLDEKYETVFNVLIDQMVFDTSPKLNLKSLMDSIQNYLDESPQFPDRMMEGHNNLSFEQAANLFNDYVTYANDGIVPDEPIYDPTAPNLGEGA